MRAPNIMHISRCGSQPHQRQSKKHKVRQQEEGNVIREDEHQPKWNGNHRRHGTKQHSSAAAKRRKRSAAQPPRIVPGTPAVSDSTPPKKPIVAISNLCTRVKNVAPQIDKLFAARPNKA